MLTAEIPLTEAEAVLFPAYCSFLSVYSVLVRHFLFIICKKCYHMHGLPEIIIATPSETAVTIPEDSCFFVFHLLNHDALMALLAVSDISDFLESGSGMIADSLVSLGFSEDEASSIIMRKYNDF